MSTEHRMLTVVPAAIAALALLVVAVPPAPAGPADLTRIRVLAIAPFGDAVYVTPWAASYGATRLAELVERRGVRVVAPSRVAETLRGLGLTARDLVSPTRTVEVGRAVGADAVLTTHITLYQQDREDAGVNGRRFGIAYTRVDASVRILEVATRVKVLEGQVICREPGIETAAMECLARGIAGRLAR